MFYLKVAVCRTAAHFARAHDNGVTVIGPNFSALCEQLHLMSRADIGLSTGYDGTDAGGAFSDGTAAYDGGDGPMYHGGASMSSSMMGGAGAGGDAGGGIVYDHAGSYGHFPLDFSEHERKAYLGGFRDRRSGLEYHHAFTQTPVERVSKWAGKAPRFERETQTSELATRSAQTKRECSAQTGRHDLLLDTSRDVARVPRPYFTADQLHAVKESKALSIQCQWRGYTARKRAAEIRSRLESQRAAALDAERARVVAEEAKFAEDVERRLHPRTPEDFAILYDEVEAWRVAETAKIKAGIPDEAGQRDALALLLERETVLLGNIERLRTRANRLNSDDGVSKRLEKMAAPKVWRLGDGTRALVQTPYTSRAQELKALYDGLGMAELPAGDRLELLTHVRATVAEFECTLTKEMSALIDREGDMISRGRPLASMLGLRQRLRTLFLTFCETPDFNPEAARFAAALIPAATIGPAAAAAASTTGLLPPTAKTRALNTTVIPPKEHGLFGLSVGAGAGAGVTAGFGASATSLGGAGGAGRGAGAGAGAGRARGLSGGGGGSVSPHFSPGGAGGVGGSAVPLSAGGNSRGGSAGDGRTVSGGGSRGGQSAGMGGMGAGVSGGMGGMGAYASTVSEMGTSLMMGSATDSAVGHHHHDEHAHDLGDA